MLSEIFKKPKADSLTVPNASHESLILGKVQLLSLPGAPGWDGQWEALVMRAEQEATALATAGVNGLLIENFHDTPYPKERMDVAGAIAMALLINRIQQFTGLPVGISVLRNDPETALAIAMNTQANFIRLSLLNGAMVTENGIINSRLNELLHYKNQLRTELPALLVDINTRQVGTNFIQNPSSRLEHLISLAKALPDTAIEPTLVVSDNDLTLDELVQFQDAVCRDVLVESQRYPEQIQTYFDHADGVILDAGIRKATSIQPDLPPAIDMPRVEELVNKLRQVVPLHEMDPAIFLQR